MIRLIRICEDRMHATLVEGITERIVREEFAHAGWPFDSWDSCDDTSASKTPYTRRWCRLDDSDGWESSTALPKRSSGFARAGARAEGVVARKALQHSLSRLSQEQIGEPCVLFIIVDLHAESASVGVALASMCEQVDDILRDETAAPCVLCVAMAPEAEAWVCAGFSPSGEQERGAHKALCDELSFDPTTQPHRLTGGDESEPNDAKRALKRLVPDKYSERAERCWTETPLETLEDRGRCAGIREFLQAVRGFAIPFLSSKPLRRTADRGGRLV